MDLQTLKTVLSGFPNLSDEAVASALAVSDKLVDMDRIDAGDLLTVISRADYGALTAGDKDYLKFLATGRSLRVTNGLRTDLSAMFANTQSLSQIQALFKRAGNRAEFLGLGSVPTPSDVANARRLP